MADIHSTEANEPEGQSDAQMEAVHGSILRERSEPELGREPVPNWLIGLFLAVSILAALYLGFFSGGFESDVFNAQAVSWRGAGPGAVKGPPDPMVVGKRVYNQNCAVCHQADGNGVAGQFPPLAGSEWVLSQDWHGDNHLIKVLLHGLQGPVQVKGNNYNNVMAAWQQLGDDKIAAVLTYIRNEWGNQALPITAEQVKQIRETTKGRTDPYTQAELKGIPRQIFDASAPPAGTPAPAADGAAPPPAEGGAQPAEDPANQPAA